MSVSSMKRLSVLTPRSEEDAVVRRLMRLRCVEIRKTQTDGLSLCNYDAEVASAEQQVRRVSEALPLLTKYTKRKSSLKRRLIKISDESFQKTGSCSTAWSVVDEVLEIKADIARCSDGEKKTAERITALLPWRKLEVPLGFAGTDTSAHIIGTAPLTADVDRLSAELAESLAEVDLISRDNTAAYISVIYHRTAEEKVNRILAEYGFVKAGFAGVDTTAAAEIARLEAELPTYDVRLQQHKDRLCTLAEVLDDVEILYDVATTTLLTAKHKQKLASTEMCAVLEGWVPADRESVVAAALSKLYCAYEMKEPEDEDVPPVLLKNNGYATNFEWVVGMYSYPKYGSYDPTLIMSIFYFIIFGLMFADVGYGLILTLAGLIAPSVLGFKPGLKRMFNMFGYCGISSMFMGVLFGGWFGDLPYAIMENMMGMENAKEAVPFFNGLLFNPIDDPIAFLIVSLAMGAVHLIAGMAVKFYLLCREGKWFDAIFDIGSWWLIFGGIAVLVLVGTLPGGIMIGVGALMIIFASGRATRNPVLRFLKGLLGLYDITSYASDLLSYCRILALGLAAGVIAQVVNLIGTMSGATVGGFIALVLSFLLGHGLNLAINILGTFVHTSRLQYLEFFNKFYEDGGEEFKPAEPSAKYSTVECDICLDGAVGDGERA
ncbi:MAG: V-type ATP synthase subunit I [Ruminococcaceae bacterium]|nr:V-type ATP synthase subunit I [Oscillospiraceae bacterium]